MCIVRVSVLPAGCWLLARSDAEAVWQLPVLVHSVAEEDAPDAAVGVHAHANRVLATQTHTTQHVEHGEAAEQATVIMVRDSCTVGLVRAAAAVSLPSQSTLYSTSNTLRVRAARLNWICHRE